jgi:hypothetical protein
MKLLVTATTCLAVLWMAHVARAQWPYGYGWQPKAATVGESRARGVADIIRSAGETNLRNSEAAINYQQARSADLDNRLKFAETYFAKRQINKQYRDENRRPAPTEEQLFRRAQAARPRRLSPTQFDPVSGKITWPLLLTDDRFADEREKLEPLFAKLAHDGRLNLADVTEVQQLGESMQASMREIIRDVPTSDYMAADRFLKSLMFEAQQVTG